MNGGSGEIVGSITEKFSSRSVSPLESRSLPACLFVDLIAIYREAKIVLWCFELWQLIYLFHEVVNLIQVYSTGKIIVM